MGFASHQAKLLRASGAALNNLVTITSIYLPRWRCGSAKLTVARPGACFTYKGRDLAKMRKKGGGRLWVRIVANIRRKQPDLCKIGTA